MDSFFFTIDVQRYGPLLPHLSSPASNPPAAKAKIRGPKFPLPIQGKHHDQVFQAELLDLRGTVRYNGQDYPTPTTAAKVIVTDWKEVNGWDFWRYLDEESGKWQKIGQLR